VRTIRLTSKRQATLPRALCDELHLAPGDAILVDARVVDGERVWVLRPAAAPRTEWFGSLKKYAEGKSHDMTAVRKSIQKARADGSL